MARAGAIAWRGVALLGAQRGASGAAGEDGDEVEQAGWERRRRMQRQGVQRHGAGRGAVDVPRRGLRVSSGWGLLRWAIGGWLRRGTVLGGTGVVG